MNPLLLEQVKMTLTQRIAMAGRVIVADEGARAQKLSIERYNDKHQAWRFQRSEVMRKAAFYFMRAARRESMGLK